MEGIYQDLLGNLVMFCALFIGARETPKRSLFWLRLLAGFAAFSLLRYGYFSHLSGLMAWDTARYMNMVVFTAFIPLLALATLGCWEMDAWAGLYCGSCAYCVQHIVNKGYDLLRRSFLAEAEAPVSFYITYITLAAVILIAFVLIAKQQRAKRIRIDSKALLLLSVLVVLTTIVLDIQVRSALRGAQPEAGNIVNWYSIIAAVIILCFQMMLVSSKDQELELINLHSLLAEQDEQYRFEKSIIDSLNIKVHDIKHQLQDLDDANRQRLAEELSPMLEAYDSRFRTENPALDVILTRKSFVCHERHIHLTAMADGTVLDFMKGSDIYSLFGNMLDNAIEAADKLENKEQKVIKLSVEKKGYFVNIHLENYFAQKLEFEDGLPRTTKPDPLYHGFGMKSIRMLAEQYDGNVKISTVGNRFILDLFFPV